MVMRPETNEYTKHQANYINLVPEGDLLAMLRKQADSLDDLLSDVSPEEGEYRYAQGKWSLKELIGHIIDTERVMSYRALCLARGDQTPLPGFDQDIYISNAGFERYSLPELLEEYQLVRNATLTLLSRLTDEAWLRTGTVNNHGISVRALGYIIAGHDLHHQTIIKERYLQKSH
jgi:hypothetical protein